MTNLAQFLVAGVALGAVYGIVALGMAVVFNATDTLNVAHGSFVVLGAAFVTTYVSVGMSLVVAALLAIATVGLVAVVQAWAVILPMIRRDATPLALLMVTVGCSIVATEAIGKMWGKQPLSFGTFLGERPIELGGVAIQRQTVAILVIGGLVVVGLLLFFRRSRHGQAMLACSVDRIAASLLGVNPQRVALMAFLVSGLLAGLAGVLITPLAAVTYTQGLAFVLKAFTAAAIGGLTSPAGAVLGGLIVGLLEALSAGYISSEYRDFIVLGVLLLVLALRPTGLLRGLRAVTA